MRFLDVFFYSDNLYDIPTGGEGEDDDEGGGGGGGGSGGSGEGGGGSGGSGSGDLPPSQDGVLTVYDCRFRFPNEVFIDRFLFVLAGIRRVSGTVIVQDERTNKRILETFIAQQGMNTIRFKERLRSDSVRVRVVVGKSEGTRPYTYDAWLGYDLLERIGGARG